MWNGRDPDEEIHPGRGALRRRRSRSATGSSPAASSSTCRGTAACRYVTQDEPVTGKELAAIAARDRHRARARRRRVVYSGGSSGTPRTRRGGPGASTLGLRRGPASTSPACPSCASRRLRPRLGHDGPAAERLRASRSPSMLRSGPSASPSSTTPCSSRSPTRARRRGGGSSSSVSRRFRSPAAPVLGQPDRRPLTAAGRRGGALGGEPDRHPWPELDYKWIALSNTTLGVLMVMIEEDAHPIPVLMAE